MEKIVFLDFDGTLSMGYMSMDFLDYVTYHGLYDRAEYDRQQQYVIDVKDGKLSYNDWLPLWAKSWALGLKGQKHDVVMEAAEEFFTDFKLNIYPSSYDVVDAFREAGFRPVMISVGAYEVTSLGARELGVDEVIATQLEIDSEGVYTGNVTTNLHTPAGKLDEINRILSEAGVNPEECAAAGDSYHDEPMLRAVGHPIALNPSEELEKAAKEHGWPSLTHETVLEHLETWLSTLK